MKPGPLAISLQGNALLPEERDILKDPLIGAIMPAHITYPCKDPEHTAGTSKVWLQDILRDELHFEGVIISDCLSMKAAGESNSMEKVLQTLRHTDMAILCHLKPQEYLALLEQLKVYTPNPKSQERIAAWFSAVSKPEAQEEIGKSITPSFKEAMKRKCSPELVGQPEENPDSAKKSRRASMS